MKGGLNQAEVVATVGRIERVSHDDEYARIEERRLWESVLVEAAGSDDDHVASLARAALATRNYVFEGRVS